MLGELVKLAAANIAIISFRSNNFSKNLKTFVKIKIKALRDVAVQFVC